MIRKNPGLQLIGLIVAVLAAGLTGCGWQGVNSLPLPGTRANGRGSYEVKQSCRMSEHPAELAGAGKRCESRPITRIERRAGTRSSP